MAKKKDKKTAPKPAEAKSGKTAKKSSKVRKTGKAGKTTAAPDLNTADMAHKIWLAGVGAYGKAYDTAIANTKAFNRQSTELFEDLVKRGEAIEKDVRARVEDNEAMKSATKSAAKYAEAAREFQTQARDEFEARVERMRDLLGVKGLGKKGSKLAAKLDKLEDEVAETVSKARSKSKARTNDLKQRITRLTEEIEAVATETGADLAKSGKKAVTRTSKAVQAAITKPAESPEKPAAKPKPATRQASVDDFTRMTGVGPALAAKLKAAGITSFAQIAALKKADIDALDAKIMARGRIVRDGWVKQARALMK